MGHGAGLAAGAMLSTRRTPPWRPSTLAPLDAAGAVPEATTARTRRSLGNLQGGSQLDRETQSKARQAESKNSSQESDVNAAFAGARPDCPRLLGLDEAFAGIDEVGRSELLSLTVTFDLDLFMTGYDLWAVDPAVPAVAHYDLLLADLADSGDADSRPRRASG